MKLKNIIKSLSMILAFLVIIVALPINVIAASPEKHETGYNEEIATDTQEEQSPTETADETDEGDNTDEEEQGEFETEVFHYEYEIEDTAMSAPPMTQIGDVADPCAPAILQDGVYAIENVGNDNFYMSVEGGYAVAGYNIVQQNYSSNTPLTDFSRVSLFKVSQVGTNRYIIRSMLNNRISPVRGTGTDVNKLETGYIDPDDSVLGTTYTIMYLGGAYIIQPYGSTDVVAAPNNTVSGSSNSTEAQLVLTSFSAAGTRGQWKFTAYTGNTQYGFSATRTASMGDGLVKGKTGNLWIKAWSTVIGANTAYLSVTPSTSSIASSVWDAYSGGATITGLKCGDFQMKAEIRSGSSQTATHTGIYSYTVIPDIVGDTAFIQNVETNKYVEVENGSTSENAIIQQNIASTHPRTQWIFELGGNGYFKIKNVNSGKYVGVDSSNLIKVRQYTSITDFTLWKLTEMSEGTYKISCKASALSDKALSAPSSTSGNGEDITMVDYQYSSSLKNVWVIKGCIGSLNITVCADEGYMARYPNYASKISQSMQDIKEKLFSDYFIEVNYSSVSSITTLADECTHSSGGNYDSQCPHGDNNNSNNNTDGLCFNSSFSLTGNANQTLHHKNLYNTVYRITFPNISENTLVIFSGHKYCKMDGGMHKDSGAYGVSWTNYGVAMIKNFKSALGERKTLLHEILHWYGIMDHYDIGDVPSSEEMGPNFSRRCIFGEDKESADVLNNLVICEGCQEIICNNLDKFDH